MTHRLFSFFWLIVLRKMTLGKVAGNVSLVILIWMYIYYIVVFFLIDSKCFFFRWEDLTLFLQLPFYNYRPWWWESFSLHSTNWDQWFDAEYEFWERKLGVPAFYSRANYTWCLLQLPPAPSPSPHPSPPVTWRAAATARGTTVLMEGSASLLKSCQAAPSFSAGMTWTIRFI